MIEKTSLSLIQSVIDTSKELIVIFKGEEAVLANKAFNSFFGVNFFEEYKIVAGTFIDHFIPHPSYFHKDRLIAGESWFDAILKLPEIDRVVSMLTQEYEPHAFSVNIDNNTEGYYVVSFVDITHDLIKRIMIESKTSIDMRSGAYSKKYFLQVAQNYEDAAIFNEKIIALVVLNVNKEFIEDFVSPELALRTLVIEFKRSIRQDDMLIHWEDNKFIILYLIDQEANTQPMVNKLQILVNSEELEGLNCHINSSAQKKGETILELIERVNLASKL